MLHEARLVFEIKYAYIVISYQVSSSKVNLQGKASNPLDQGILLLNYQSHSCYTLCGLSDGAQTSPCDINDTY
jgi:hypothetical protein